MLNWFYVKHRYLAVSQKCAGCEEGASYHWVLKLTIVAPWGLSIFDSVMNVLWDDEVLELYSLYFGSQFS